MQEYCCRVDAETREGAKLSYQVALRAGTVRDAAEKCKLLARLELNSVEVDFSNQVEVWVPGSDHHFHHVE